jgi:hypothetical protein
LGTGDGSSAINAEAITQLYANWAVVNPGDKVHLCGVFTNTVGMQGNGATLYFEPNAIITQPAGLGLYVFSGLTNVTIDGGLNGVIQCTANGTGLANQIAVNGMQVSGISNMTVQNLHFNNLYLHTSIDDPVCPIQNAAAIMMQQDYGSINIQNCTFTNIGWCISQFGSPTTMTVSNCTFENYDHGVVPNGANWVVQNCFFGDAVNWDTVANVYHHDAIHYYGGTINSMVIVSNMFNGDFGGHGTAYIYLETGGANSCLIANNVFIMHPGNLLGDGPLCGGLTIVNNTFIGNKVPNSTAITTGGSGAQIENNLVSGFTTFVSLIGPVANSSIDHNLYANIVPGGNNPFSANGATYPNLASWQKIASEANSMFVTAQVANPDGTVPTFSEAVGTGINLSSLLQTDINGKPRPSNGPWVIGAYSSTTAGVLPAPSNLHVVPPGGITNPTNVANGLLAWWQCGDGSGTTVADSTGNGYNGILRFIAGTFFSPGQLNMLSANTGFIDLGATPALMPVPFTYTAWVCPSNSGAYLAIISAGSGGVYFRINPLSQLEFIKSQTALIAASTNTVPNNVSTFAHVALSCDASGNYVFYINGVPAGSGNTPQTFSYTYTTVGADNASADFFNGAIKMVDVFNRVLSPGEVKDLYYLGTQ